MSGTTANLHNDPLNIDQGNDAIVIISNLETIPGGRTLDVSGLASDVAVLRAGHIIIEETATKQLKPMPLNSGKTAYGTLPADHTYKGVLVSSILRTKPFAAILVRGTVNQVASPFSVASGAKTALTLIRFTED